MKKLKKHYYVIYGTKSHGLQYLNYKSFFHIYELFFYGFGLYIYYSFSSKTLIYFEVLNMVHHQKLKMAYMFSRV